jgi:hypothetical protein
MMMTGIGFNPMYRAYNSRPAFKNSENEFKPKRFATSLQTDKDINTWQSEFRGRMISLNKIKEELVSHIN